MLRVINEFTREFLGVRVERRFNINRCVRHPGRDVRRSWSAASYSFRQRLGVYRQCHARMARKDGREDALHQAGSHWDNGYCESFNSKLRDELLACKIFYDLRETKVFIEGWRLHYNTARPLFSPGYRSPAPETILLVVFIRPHKLNSSGLKAATKQLPG